MPAHDSSTPQTTLPSAGVPHDRGLAPVLWCDGVVAPLRLKPPRVRRALPRPARAAGRPWHVRPRLVRAAAQVIQELLRYAAMQLHVPGMRSRGPLRERTKSICGMVCGCNDRKHCVAGPDPPRTAGLSIIRTCQHKATRQPAPGPSQIRAARRGSTYASTPQRWCSTGVDAHGCVAGTRVN